MHQSLGGYVTLFCFRLNFLSINRFERKKNIKLAISAFTMLHTLEDDAPQRHNVADVTLTVVGKALHSIVILGFLYILLNEYYLLVAIIKKLQLILLVCYSTFKGLGYMC